MSTINIGAGELSDLLSPILPAIQEKKNTTPVLSGVLLDFDAQTIQGTDGSLEIGQKLPQLDASGQYVLPAKKLSTIAKAARNDDSLSISLGDRCKIKSSGATYQVQALRAADFPRNTDEFNEHATKLAVDSQELINALKLVGPAAAKNDVRYYLQGVYVEIDAASRLNLVATDGHRLAYQSLDCEIKTQTSQSPADLILPNTAVEAISKSLPDGPVEIIIGERGAAVTAGDLWIKTRLIEGKYPNYKQVLPKTVHHLVVTRDSLGAALRRVTPMLGKQQAVKVRINGDQINILATNDNEETAEANAACQPPENIPEIETAYNADYLASAVSSLDAEQLELCLTEDPGSGGAIFRASGKSDTFHLILPVRL